MREMTNLTVMIGAFTGASIPHLGHPIMTNILWLGAAVVRVGLDSPIRAASSRTLEGSP